MKLFLVLVLSGFALGALDVDLSSTESIKAAARLKAYDVMSFYKGNQSGQIPGILPGPPPIGDYYWWQGGALWGTMIDYWRFTGDSTYNKVVQDALLFQTGPQNNYMPPNWTASLGNDDQAFWGMTAMLAAETNFENPPTSSPQWLALAQAVFNTQASPTRHDDTCGGGLRWQIPALNVGYDYKNSIANGCFFNIGARLARYTDNDTYAQWAEETWDWMQGVGFIDNEYNVYDGGHVGYNCTDINKQQFSYNVAILLQGAAFMYNYTNGASAWETRVDGLLTNLLKVFFPKGVAYELSCESSDVPGTTCTTDMKSFKGYVHRWLATTSQVAPFTKSKIVDAVMTSTQAAVNQCTGGDTGRTCGFRWASGSYDGTKGAGQEMNVLGALISLLIEEAPGPFTAENGGTSRGDPNAGGDANGLTTYRPITTADKAGAGILTAVVLALLMGTFYWMGSGMSEYIK